MQLPLFPKCRNSFFFVSLLSSGFLRCPASSLTNVNFPTEAGKGNSSSNQHRSHGDIFIPIWDIRRCIKRHFPFLFRSLVCVSFLFPMLFCHHISSDDNKRRENLSGRQFFSTELFPFMPSPWYWWKIGKKRKYPIFVLVLAGKLVFGSWRIPKVKVSKHQSIKWWAGGSFSVNTCLTLWREILQVCWSMPQKTFCRIFFIRGRGWNAVETFFHSGICSHNETRIHWHLTNPISSFGKSANPRPFQANFLGGDRTGYMQWNEIYDYGLKWNTHTLLLTPASFDPVSTEWFVSLRNPKSGLAGGMAWKMGKYSSLLLLLGVIRVGVLGVSKDMIRKETYFMTRHSILVKTAIVRRPKWKTRKSPM